MSDEIQKVYVQAAVEVTDKFLHISRSVHGLFTANIFWIHLNIRQLSCLKFCTYNKL